MTDTTDTVPGTDRTHAHAPVPHHAALRPAWWLSGGPARCNAAPVADGQRSTVAPSPPTLDVANVGGGEPPVSGPLRNGVESLWR